jgi:hypothetical protein
MIATLVWTELGLLGTGHQRGEATKEGWDKEVEWEHVSAPLALTSALRLKFLIG